MELEPSSGFTPPPPDKRPHMPPPPPVSLVAVEDVHLPAEVGQEEEVDRLYAGILGFERGGAEGKPVYRADNFDLYIDLLESPPGRESFRMLGVVVPSLADVMNRLIDAEIEFTRQRAITPGRDAVVLLDPGGNWLEITERSSVR